MSAESELIDAIIPLVAGTASVRVGVPTSWTSSSPTHYQVFQAAPSTSQARHSRTSTLVQVTVWAADTVKAQSLASDLHTRLLRLRSTDRVSAILPRLGVMPVHDPETHAELATFTVDVRLRVS